MSGSDIDALVGRFDAATLPHAEWTHAAHLIVGTWHVQQYGPDEALTRLRIGIRRLNESHGTPNSATSGYHETVTRAYVHLLAAFLAACPAEMPLATRVARLLASPLAERNVLLGFYSRDRLTSPEARAAWIEPDVAPLALPANR